jgi:Glycosyl hydrolase family 115/Gylcosyl hydrolase family 115 C-terminal domain/Glycosyl hydrolase family 67 N-terminus
MNGLQEKSSRFVALWASTPMVTSLMMLLSLFGLCSNAFALGQEQYVETTNDGHNFVIAKQKQAATLYVDTNDYAGVVRAVNDLQADIKRVTDCTAAITHQTRNLGETVILIGTLGKSPLIDQLVREHKIDVKAIAGEWESFTIQTVSNPFPEMSSALVIAGSDKRGTIYGVYDLSEQIGVSPWYWWADVAVRHQDTLTVKPGIFTQGPPAVKYRGIFLNDEAPSLTGWVKEKYGNYNHEFYEKVFELILRLKGNYLWPAMWNNAFSEDDPLNPKLADEYGIVMGTTHHEPMMRAQQEWKRHGNGAWDYSKNAPFLRQFWEEGLERNKDYENIVTVGMRGDGDLPMSESANIALLEQIVTDQRKIISDVYHRDADSVPQDWALYKEVQEYYEKGMRVADVVTLLWCDDNWGNIRRLPTPEERKRGGGAGIYYHFDYVGDPRSYKWINTNPIPKVWEQMNLALNYGADRIWIVNVGDLKPMEFPIEFFLSMAWNPARWPRENITEFAKLWAAREFGPRYASEIADIVAKCGKFNGRRKPELLEPTTYSVVNYREADTVAAAFQAITKRAEAVYKELPEDEKESFYQLVLYPTKASATVTQLYVTAGKNQLYATQRRASTNELASEAQALFQLDAELSAYYNHTLAHGKWDHMMDQTHIGYTSWNEPPVNNMPRVTKLDLPAAASVGIAVEGSAAAWPGAAEPPRLPHFDVYNKQRHYIDVFNRGKASFTFTATATEPWIVLSESKGEIDLEKRIWVSVDWLHAPQGLASGSIKISSNAGPDMAVKVDAFRPAEPMPEKLDGFVEGNGYVSIEAVHYTNKIDVPPGRWEKIDDLGRTLSAMTIFPVTAASLLAGQPSPCLEYKMYLFHAGTVEVQAILDPTLNFVPGRGLRYAVSFDEETPQVVDFLSNDSTEKWAASVKDSVRIGKSTHTIANPGYHTLKIWMVDPAVVLQKLVVDLGGVKPSYLGPPESCHVTRSENPGTVAAAQPR